MYRRSFIALATVVPLAGCSSLLGGGVDTTLEEDERVEFDADEGAELTVTVEVQEVHQPSEDMDLEREGIMLRLDHADAGIVDTWTIEDTATLDVTVENGGTHTVIVSGGVADVTVE